MMDYKKMIIRKMPGLLYRYWLIREYFNSKQSLEQMKNAVQKKYKKYVCEKGINWENPITYTEKINYSKIYLASQQKSYLTDKVTVRNWIEEEIGGEYLVPIYGIYDDFDSINFDGLPERFVMKCNHDSNSVSLCDKKNLNINMLRIKYKYLLKRNYAYEYHELHYKMIKPKIIIEHYLGDRINDYKFLCFSGIPYYCWVDFDRFGNHKRNIYDMDWNLQPFNQKNYGNYEKIVEKPKQFDEMKQIVLKLCKGFDHVRVDLYIVNDKVYFGEMTFTNGSGYESIVPVDWDKKLGDLWKIERL